ncbi:MAG: hypothetical protein WC285_05375 [Candidatus Gracilibacteria bacterium]
MQSTGCQFTTSLTSEKPFLLADLGIAALDTQPTPGNKFPQIIAQRLRQKSNSVLATLPLPHQDRTTVEIKIADFQIHDLANPKPGAIGKGQG